MNSESHRVQWNCSIHEHDSVLRKSAWWLLVRCHWMAAVHTPQRCHDRASWTKAPWGEKCLKCLCRKGDSGQTLEGSPFLPLHLTLGFSDIEEPPCFILGWRRFEISNSQNGLHCGRNYVGTSLLCWRLRGEDKVGVMSIAQEFQVTQRSTYATRSASFPGVPEL